MRSVATDGQTLPILRSERCCPLITTHGNYLQMCEYNSVFFCFFILRGSLVRILAVRPVILNYFFQKNAEFLP